MKIATIEVPEGYETAEEFAADCGLRLVAEDSVAQYLIDIAPDPFKFIGERLADLLDADPWNNIEPLLLDLAARLATSEKLRPWAEDEQRKREAVEESLLLERQKTDRLIAALKNIKGFGDVDLSGEWEHALRDIIRSMTDCAQDALRSCLYGGEGQ